MYIEDTYDYYVRNSTFIQFLNFKLEYEFVVEKTLIFYQRLSEYLYVIRLEYFFTARLIKVGECVC